VRVAEAGADGDALNAPQNGWTPLHAASSHDHAEVVRALLATGADVEAKDEVSMTPSRMDSALHKFGHVSCTRWYTLVRP
jgi:ankyrin repeat protein